MPPPEEAIQFVPECHPDQDGHNGDSDENKKPPVLAVPDIGAAEGQEYRAEKPSRAPNDEEFGS